MFLILDSTDSQLKNRNGESAAKCWFQFLGQEMTIVFSIVRTTAITAIYFMQLIRGGGDLIAIYFVCILKYNFVDQLNYKHWQERHTYCSWTQEQPQTIIIFCLFVKGPSYTLSKCGGEGGSKQKWCNFTCTIDLLF